MSYVCHSDFQPAPQGLLVGHALGMLGDPEASISNLVQHHIPRLTGSSVACLVIKHAQIMLA